MNCQLSAPGPTPFTHLRCFSNFPGGSDGREFTCNAGDPDSIPGLGSSSGGELLQPTEVFLPGESPWTEEPGRYSPWGRQELDMTEWLTLPLFFTVPTPTPLMFHLQLCLFLCSTLLLYPSSGLPDCSSIVAARLLIFLCLGSSSLTYPPPSFQLLKEIFPNYPTENSTTSTHTHLLLPWFSFLHSIDHKITCSLACVIFLSFSPKKNINITRV